MPFEISSSKYPDKHWPFKTVIIDESQGFKGYSSSRFKALKQIKPFIERTICLTGTPNPNGLEDLWAQVYLVDMGAHLGTTITAFRETYFTPGRCANGYPYEWIPKPGAKEVIFARIRDIAISIEGVEHDKTIKTHIIQLTTEERKQYVQLKKTHVLYMEDDVVIDGQNAAILAGKLTQLAAGSIYIPVPEGEAPPAKRDYIAFHSHKLQKCVEIVNNTDSPTLIAYAFQSDKERLLNAFGNRAKVFDGSTKMMQSWNQQLIEVLLIHPASAGHGLNFQYGGHTLIWYTLPWYMEHYLQTNARIARQGQTSPVTIHVLIIENTIDERISAALTRKELDARELQKAVNVEFISQEDKAA